MRYEPRHDKTNKMACAPSEDSDQPGHPPSLIRVFAVHMKKAFMVLSYPLSAQRRLWSDWAEAQADLSLRWANSHFVRFVTSWLIYWLSRPIDAKLCMFFADKSFEPRHEKTCLRNMRLGKTQTSHLAEYSYFIFPVWASSRVLNFQVLQINYLRIPSTMSPRLVNTSRNNRRCLANSWGKSSYLGQWSCWY